MSGSETSESDDGTTSPSSVSVRVHCGVRVARMERDESTRRWRLLGQSGEAAYHDTSEKVVRERAQGHFLLGDEAGYDAVILTDVSSSFGKWHRASAGVPEEFAQQVRRRVGARVPLMTAGLRHW